MKTGLKSAMTKMGAILAIVLMVGVHGVVSASDVLDSAVMASYGKKRDIKAVAEAVLPIYQELCNSNDIIVCMDANKYIAISLAEQARFQEAIVYLDRYWAALASSIFGKIKRRDDCNELVYISFLVGGTDPYGNPLVDQYTLNHFWYYFQAKAQAGDKDFSYWLHKTYQCAIFGKSIFRNELSIYQKETYPTYGYSKTLLDGRVVHDNLLDDGGKFDKNKYQTEILPAQYVAEIRRNMGDVEAATAQRFIDEIVKPLNNALIKAKNDSSKVSAEPQREAQLDAAKATLYDNAVSAARTRGFPPIYVETLIAEANRSKKETKWSVERGAKQ